MGPNGEMIYDIESSPEKSRELRDARGAGFAPDMSPPPTKKTARQDTAHFIGLVTLWYISAMVTITTSKMILKRLPLPTVVSYFQFGIACLCGNLFMHWKGIPALDITFRSASTAISTNDGNRNFANGIGIDNGDGSSIGGGTVSSDAEEARRRTLLWQISLSYGAGFLLTNQAFSLSSVSFAETIKSAEPVFTVGLNYFLFSVAPRTDVLLALTVIILGVGTSCVGDYNFEFTAFTCAILSNICFGCRAVLTKSLFKATPHDSKGKPDAYSGLKLFTKVSELGAILMVPVAMYREGWALFSSVMGSGEDSVEPATLTFCCLLMFVNGICYACYNLMSFVVLGKTDVVSHAALNIFRRVVIIFSTSFFFGVTLTQLNVCGVFIAVVGAVGYTRVKTKLRQV